MNYDLEYQKSEVNSGFMYNSAEQREKMVAAERKWVDDRTEMVLALKRKVCKPGETFCIINQKGIDPLAPEVLGWADSVEEQSLGEEVYTFLEGVRNPFSCTILVKGAHKHVIAQIQEAVRDGTRAVANALT